MAETCPTCNAELASPEMKWLHASGRKTVVDSKQIKLEGHAACHFVLGYYAALLKMKRRIPKNIDAAAKEARDVLTGGSFRGPLAVWDMEKTAQELARAALA